MKGLYACRCLNGRHGTGQGVDNKKVFDNQRKMSPDGGNGWFEYSELEPDITLKVLVPVRAPAHSHTSHLENTVNVK